MIHKIMISVIVAHAGCRFFYKFLVSEAKRAEVEPSCFDDIKFCDNLQHLQQVLYIVAQIKPLFTYQLTGKEDESFRRGVNSQWT